MVNAKALRTKDIQMAFDVIEAHLTQFPQKISAGMTAIAMATSMVEKTLTDINHQMRANAGRILESHRAAVTNNKSTIATEADLSDEARAFVEQTLGITLGAKTATPASATPAAPMSAATPSIPASNWTVADGKERGLNTLIQTITNNDQLTLQTLLNVADRLDGAMEAANGILDALKNAVENGTPVDGIASIDPLTQSGLAALPTSHPMVESLNDLLAAHVTPAITWESLIGSINSAETALTEAHKTSLTLRWQARVASAPKTVVTVAETNPSTPQQDVPMQVTVAQVKASDIFPNAYGASASLLAFNVPSMVVNDPDVPDIDPSYKFYVPVLVEALQTIADNEIMWLYGDSGCGKSEFWKQLAARLGMPFTRLNMDGHLTRGDIIGINRMVPNADKQQEMRFLDGILPRAMVKPGLLLIDELDLGDPEIMAVLQPVLEGEPLRILEDSGRVVRPHPLFRIAITGNTTGLGSASNAYVNAHEQSAATRDRIAAYVEMPYMTPQIEKQVIQERMPGIPDTFLDKLIQLANTVRVGYRQGDVNQIFSTRSTLAASRRYLRFASLYPSENDAVHAILENVILNRMDESSRNAVKGYIDNIFA